jgi:hypothetical protein
VARLPSWRIRSTSAPRTSAELAGRGEDLLEHRRRVGRDHGRRDEADIGYAVLRVGQADSGRVDGGETGRLGKPIPHRVCRAREYEGACGERGPEVGAPRRGRRPRAHAGELTQIDHVDVSIQRI